MKEIKKTKSICPECFQVIDATLYEKNGKIIMEKECSEHGHFSDIVWSDAKYYHWAESYMHDGTGLSNPQTKGDDNCPYACGICNNHLTSTLLANIDITNRCNMHCPICFANAAAAGYVLEPSKSEITTILENLVNEKPVRCWGVQFSGGEPTIRDDFPEIIAEAKRLGFTQIQIATNGKRFSKDPEFAKKVLDSGVNTVYLQFDGINEAPYIAARGYNALPEKLKAIKNMRDVGYTSVVLVPTLVKGVNDDQVGDIVRFAMDNGDIIKGVNFQPVSFSGRIDKEELEKKRITIPDLGNLLEEQTKGQIGKKDLYPVPSVSVVSDIIAKWKQTPQVSLTCHAHCGVGTYLFKNNGDIIPITRFVDVDGLFSLLKEVNDDMGNGGKIAKVKAVTKLSREIPKLIDNSKAPDGLNLRNLLLNIITNGTVEDTAAFHNNTLFLGAMHFMDPYNFDLERVCRCGIHYGLLDGRVIPFCTYNTLHREKFEKKYGIPLSEWKKHNK